MKSRKYPTVEEAYEHLNTLGKLETFGRSGTKYEYMVCKITLPSGQSYFIDVYRDGNVILSE